MGVFVLEDLQDSVEVTLFPRVMQEHGYKLSDDAIVLLKARLDKRDETPKLIGMEITAFEGFAEAAPPLRLNLPAAVLSEERIDRLKAMLAEHPGESPVYLHLGEGKVLRLPDQHRVDLPRVVGELRVAFGHEAVVLSSPGVVPRGVVVSSTLRGGAFPNGVRRWQNGDPPVKRTGGPTSKERAGTPPAPELPGAVTTMAIQVETKDSTALTDADLDEMASMGGAFGIGDLSKAKEDWVLATRARIDGKLNGYAFSTLERIGGTPCVLLGMLSVKRTAKREAVLKGLMGEAFHRALMAFPDEDVVVGARFVAPDGVDAFRPLTDIIPRAGHRAVGEERAWGRRLAKRFGVGLHLRRAELRREVQRPVRLPGPRDPQAREDRSRRVGPLPGRQRGQGRVAHRLRLDDGRGPAQAGLPRLTGDAPDGRGPSPFEDVVRRRRMIALVRSVPPGAGRAARRAGRPGQPGPERREGPGLAPGRPARGSDTSRFWDVTLPPERRAGFAWPGLLDAPVIALPLADPEAYVRRYGEPDKAASGLGRSAEAWPVPYWTVDTAFAVMTLLLAAEERGWARCSSASSRVSRSCAPPSALPAHLELLGAIALGWPAADVGAAGAVGRRAGGASPARSSTGAGGEAQEPAWMPHFSCR